MLIEDQLKDRVRHHLANWKTLRGVTPFYSKMFWPPLDVNPVTETRNEKFTEFQSIQLHMQEICTNEDITRAQEEYPKYSEIIGVLKGLCLRVRPHVRSDIGLCPAPDGNVTFNIVAKAFELEEQAAKATKSAWTPLKILKLSLKLKEFSEDLDSPVVIHVGRESFVYERGVFSGLGFVRTLMGVNVERAMHVIAKHATPPASIRKQHDLAALAADIASQGYDEVFLYDGTEDSHCITGLKPIKSIRSMAKYLGRTMRVKTRENIEKPNLAYSAYKVIRPFVKAEYGVRVFVVKGEIVAATAQTVNAIPGHQTEPFTDEIGTSLSVAHHGAYKTCFQTCRVDPVIFKELMEKANTVASDLKQIGELHYAMDLLIDEKGDYAIDLLNLGFADYFALSPAIIARALQRVTIGDMCEGVPSAKVFSTPELGRLARFSMRDHARPVYTLEKQSRDRDDQFRSSRETFSMIVDNTARIRELLQTEKPVEQKLQSQDEVWLAKRLAIFDDHFKDYDLKGFAEAIETDFRERFPGKIDNLWKPKVPLHLVPLLDAALWFKQGQTQTWRYCLSNQCNKTVTVRPIGSAPSRSERRSQTNGQSFERSKTEQYVEDGWGQFDDDVYSGSLSAVPAFEAQAYEEPDDGNTGDGSVVDFFLTLLEQDEE